MAEGGQIEAELKAGRSEEQARNGVERRNGGGGRERGDRRDPPGCGWRSTWTQRAFRILYHKTRLSCYLSLFVTLFRYLARHQGRLCH